MTELRPATIRVTKRFHYPVTRRYEDPLSNEAITHRYQEAATISPASFSPGTLIADCYRILTGPIGGSTGEGEVYRCWDEHRKTEVAFKLYRHQFKPKEPVILQLQGLSHPNIVRLLSHGLWQNRFFEVTEFCHGGVFAECMPLSEAELLNHLKGILQGLDYCHQQGIVHRDIKPNNLFFRDAARTEPLIGDFGISSYLDLGQGVQVTQTASHLTLDYASPELLDGHKVSAKTDFYALGITLIHLLLNQSPFAGLSANDILVAHLRGRISIPDYLSAEFKQLLQGLLVPDSERRWGFTECVHWLKGEPVSSASFLATPTKQADQGNPFPGYVNATNPRELGLALDQFDAEKYLFRGDIRRWVFDYFDSELADHIEQLEVGYRDRPEQALIKLRFLLNPGKSLAFATTEVTTIRALVGILLEGDKVTKEALEDAFWNQSLDFWIESGQLAGTRTTELVQKLNAIRQRLSRKGHPGAALFALRYTLDPTQPLKLLPNREIKHPSDLGAAYKWKRHIVEKALQRLIYGRYFEEWIRAAEFDDWREHTAFIEDARLRYLDKPVVGTYAVLWHFDPDIPFPFLGQSVRSPEQLAQLIDQDQDSWQKGLGLLKRDWVRAWLVSSGRIVDAKKLDFVLLDTNVSDDAKLEAIVRLLDPSIDPPDLVADPKRVNFGNVDPGIPRTRALYIKNKGRGFLSGDLSWQQSGLGFSVDRFTFEGSETKVVISADSIGLEPGTYRNQLRLHSNSQPEQVEVMFRVKETEGDVPWWQKVLDRIQP